MFNNFDFNYHIYLVIYTFLYYGRTVYSFPSNNINFSVINDLLDLSNMYRYCYDNYWFYNWKEKTVYELKNIIIVKRLIHNRTSLFTDNIIIYSKGIRIVTLYFSNSYTSFINPLYLSKCEEICSYNESCVFFEQSNSNDK